VQSHLNKISARFWEFYRTGIYNKIMSGKDNWEALLALLSILCAANLESITFQCQTYQPKYILNLLDLAANKERGYFPKLRRVILMPDPHAQFALTLHGNACFNTLLSHTLRIRHLPGLHLKHLFSSCVVNFVRDGKSQTGTQTGSLETFAIKVLSITDSHLASAILRDTLTRFDSLTHFKLQHPITAINAFDLVPIMIEDGLLNSRYDLEELVLEGADADDSSRNGRVFSPLKNMESFKKLKVIKVQATRLLGHEPAGNSSLPHYTKQCTDFANRLPPSLEHLTLTDCRLSIYNPISELLLSPKMPPNLKSIEISFDMHQLLTHVFGDLTITMWL